MSDTICTTHAQVVDVFMSANDGATYTILAGGKAIRCERPGCGKTSWSVDDATKKYCVQHGNLFDIFQV